MIEDAKEKILFDTGARITRDSWECYFCHKPIVNIPYMEFDVLYSGDVGSPRRIEQRAHCRCFGAARRKATGGAKTMICPDCNTVIRGGKYCAWCPSCLVAYDLKTSEKLKSECCDARVFVFPYRTICEKCETLVDVMTGRKLI